MPKLANNVEGAIRRAIRDAYAIDPLIDGNALLKYLNDKFNRTFSWRYIQKMIRKADGDATPRLDKVRVATELKSINETTRIHIEMLTRISLGQQVGDRPAPKYAEMIMAARAIAILKKLQIDAMIDLGIFDKTLLPTLGPKSREIPAELIESMVETAKLWELPSDLTAQIDAGGTITVDTTIMPQKVETQNVPAKMEEKQLKENDIDIRQNNGIEAVPEFRVS